MPFLDQVEAVAPVATEEERAKTRRQIERLAIGEQWLALLLDQHKAIERRFAETLSNGDPEVRRVAARRLANALNGHSAAEETVLYPALMEHGSGARAERGYEDHAVTKVQLAQLEALDPLASAWVSQVRRLQRAVRQHIHEEESVILPSLCRNLSQQDRKRLAGRLADPAQSRRATSRSTCIGLDIN